MDNKTNKSFRIEARKKDGRLHYHWQTNKIFESNEVVAFYNQAPREVVHHTNKQTYPFDSHGLEVFWTKMPFSLGLAIEEGTPNAISYYCNIHEPFLRKGDMAIEFIDLDLDVVKPLKESTARVVDWDEFEEHSSYYKYPAIYQETVPAISQKLMETLNSNFSEGFFLGYFYAVRDNQEVGPWLSEISDKLRLDLFPALS